MTSESFSSLISRLIEQANRQPMLFSARIIGIGLLAHAASALVFAWAHLRYLMAFLALLFIVTAILIATILPAQASNWEPLMYLALLGILIFIYSVTRVRRVNDLILDYLPNHPVAPNGLLLKPLQCPLLTTLIDETGEALGSPHIRGIVVTDMLDVAVVDVTVRRLLDWQVSYLLVGLPLMLALSPLQFSALVTQRLARLSGRTAAGKRYIALAIARWQHLAVLFERDRKFGHGTVAEMAAFWSGYLNAYLIALELLNSITADRDAAALAGADELANALLNQRLKQAFLANEFWPELQREAEHTSTPPYTPYSQLSEAFAAIDPEKAKVWVTEAILLQTLSDDGAPPLADRLSLLGERPFPPPPVLESAAHFYLGDSLPDLIASLDDEWLDRVTVLWGERHNQIVTTRETLAALESRREQGETLTIDESLQLAQLIEESRGGDEGLREYRHVLEMVPDHAAANFATGRLLLAVGDAGGAELIEKAIHTDENNYLLPGVETIHAFLVAAGRSCDAEEFLDRHSTRYNRLMEMRQETMALALQERSRLDLHDHYIEHEMPTTSLERLCDILARHPQIVQAYLVCKHVEHHAEIPYYVLGLVCRSANDNSVRRKQEAAMIQQIREHLDYLGHISIVILDDRRNAQMWTIVEEVPGSLIYRGKEG